jgi:hypothetical protein
MVYSGVGGMLHTCGADPNRIPIAGMLGYALFFAGTAGRPPECTGPCRTVRGPGARAHLEAPLELPWRSDKASASPLGRGIVRGGDAEAGTLGGSNFRGLGPGGWPTRPRRSPATPPEAPRDLLTHTRARHGARMARARATGPLADLDQIRGGPELGTLVLDPVRV